MLAGGLRLSSASNCIHRLASAWRQPAQLHAPPLRNSGAVAGRAKSSSTRHNIHSAVNATAEGNAVTTAGAPHNAYVLSLLMLLNTTYERLYGRTLFVCEDLLKLPDSVQHAPVAVVASDSAANAVYMNYAAHEALEGNPGLPSSRSAQAIFGQELGQLTQLVNDSSSPVQLGSKGQPAASPVNLPELTLWSSRGEAVNAWNVEAVPIDSPSGERVGLAVMFSLWQTASGAVAMPGVSPSLPGKLPSEADVEAAGLAVKDQADSIRALKQGGAGNKDPAVVEAVKQLQQRKQQLAELEALLELKELVQTERPDLVQ